MVQTLLSFSISDPLLGFVFYIFIGLFISSIYVRLFNKQKTEINIYYYLVGIIGSYIGGGLRSSFVSVDELAQNYLNPVDVALSILFSLLLIFIFRFMFINQVINLRSVK